MEAGTRVEVKSEKRHPNDFALWKKAEPEHIMRWPSPWSVGFPGWHVECSAMSMKYLGETFDIHGGGIDNQFPHHECEIAQSEGATDKPFVRYWIHNNLVTVNGQKMSKSLGNVILLKDGFKKWRPAVIRFFILQSHYRSTLDFSDEAIDGAAKGFERLLNTLRNVRERARTATGNKSPAPIDVAKYKADFLAALDDDFNTPQAIAVLFDLSREVNQLLGSAAGAAGWQEVLDFFAEATGILGLDLSDSSQQQTDSAGTDDKLMDLIIALRQEARAQKLWSLSDRIRDSLAKLGIVLEDKKEGTTWKRTG
jgi:cysteinyl-tRNA synthetase